MEKLRCCRAFQILTKPLKKLIKIFEMFLTLLLIPDALMLLVESMSLFSPSFKSARNDPTQKIKKRPKINNFIMQLLKS